ncbi:eukaryotic translation initiation factor 4 gamma 3-like [Contarinia nasturtii]|uniref:eukaryotic translation initiation factor 4 gamma 3-like n=1 Tax=Contarinia nasturtii TaxID=265458 RepID=UPI0012D3AA3B|nr:eukaryotic translation initiation factor 4 gamma 3-like [Contarinia nasturtii]
MKMSKYFHYNRNKAPTVVTDIGVPNNQLANLSSNQMNGNNRPHTLKPYHRPKAKQTIGGHMNNDGDINYEHQMQTFGDLCHTNGTLNRFRMYRSIQHNAKRNQAENVWKPSFFQKHETDGNAVELYKQVRLILNRLTSQNFDILAEKFQRLVIDTKEKLIEVINLIFNKAVNEPKFMEGYAKLCQYLSHCSKKIDLWAGERAYFKRILINKCQVEFEQHVANKNTTKAALVPLMEKMKACQEQNDQNGIKDINVHIVEEESAFRRRLVSTVHFIGELYKLDMLRTNTMNVCIRKLIREGTRINSNPSQANEKLECLCKLLTTVGGKLEQKSIQQSNGTTAQYLDLSKYIIQLKRIADNKAEHFKASNRIRFMIIDLIELRKKNWMPKTGTKTNQ